MRSRRRWAGSPACRCTPLSQDDLLGVLRRFETVRRQMPVTLAYPNSPAAFAFGGLAARIWNEEPPDLHNKPGLLNFFRRIVKPTGWEEARNG